MKKLLSLCVVALSLFGSTWVQSRTYTPETVTLEDTEDAPYTETDEIRHHSTDLVRRRTGNITEILLDGEPVLRITQSRDGRETEFAETGAPTVTRMIFTESIFDLPHGAIAHGTVYARQKDTNQIVQEAHVDVKVEKMGYTSIYTYVRQFNTEREIEKVTFVRPSRLPERQELMVVTPQGITTHLILTRLRPQEK